MKLAVPNQANNGETRVALVPAVIKRLVASGLEIVVESGAGLSAGAGDDAYEQVGAKIAPPNGPVPEAIWADAEVITTLRPPTTAQAQAVKASAVLMGMLAPLNHPELVKIYRQRRVTALAMELIPRISRAQSMDALSSQANIAGYKASVLAAQYCPKMFPMMITAAGTLAPARVFVVGAGVAGLQAIATAKRLGAIVQAFDVRPAVKEQVESLGARFVELAVQTKEATGGYAQEQTEQQRHKQSAMMNQHVIGADAVITTAAVFGKPPPMLIPADTVDKMSAGSIIVDLAADLHHSCGNCERTRPGETYTTENGVTIIGQQNLSTLVPVHASQAYASNIQALLNELIHDGVLALNLNDEIQKGAVITHEGELVNELIRKQFAEKE